MGFKTRITSYTACIALLLLTNLSFAVERTHGGSGTIGKVNPERVVREKREYLRSDGIFVQMNKKTVLKRTGEIHEVLRFKTRSAIENTSGSAVIDRDASGEPMRISRQKTRKFADGRVDEYSYVATAVGEQQDFQVVLKYHGETRYVNGIFEAQSIVEDVFFR